MSCSSMTGFGRAAGRLSERFTVSLTVRSVNHRFLDVQVRTGLREEAPEVEAAIRRAVSAVAQRGRVVVQADFRRTAPAPAEIAIDREGVRRLLAEIRTLDLPAEMMAPVTLRDLLAVPGIVTAAEQRTVFTAEELDRLVTLSREAMDGLAAMRLAEGRRLAAQIEAELAALEDFLDWFEPRMASIKEALFARLKTRLEEMLGAEAGVDHDRLVMEAAVQADRCDVSEEMVRLRGHVTQFRSRLAAGGVVGRSLDFLCQELNRELNTLGSKYRDPEATARLVDAKSAVEKIREQVQNIE